ncbi:MAG: DUF6020 family protein [Bacteroidales bacterium]|nr:DUF6020 family protein [Lachnoclostridium sp.]MCM1383104.1 DUF6020 family protein [Lachnoclostridium sp.]MCM1465404.1 DUF6020 family protein [Bacteroidales bacterium]
MRRNGLFVLLGFLFVFFQKAERDLAQNGNIVWNGKYLLWILLISLAAGGLLGYAAGEAVHRIPTLLSKKFLHGEKRVLPAGAFAIIFLLIVLSWLPCYLAYYPAICSYDTDVQTGQIESHSYNDHHPIAHTLLLEGAMNIGKNIFGDTNTGIGIYGCLQLLFLAGAFTYGNYLVNRTGSSPILQLLLLLYEMFYPFHWYMSISTIKDTVFSGFFLLQMLSIYAILRSKRNSLRPAGQDALFFVSTLGMILFRNNGKYAMLVLLCICLLGLWRDKEYRKCQGRLLANAFLAFVVGNISLTLLFSAVGAEQGDKREMLSMPIQQLARCMIYHGGAGLLPEDDNSMSEEDKALIRDFLLDESYLEYRPDISDPVKRHTNTYVVRYRTEDFIRTYLHLLAEYPGDFVNAALAVNAGYLAPGDVSHALINVNGAERGLGYVQTRWVEDVLRERGIYKDSKWESLHEALESWADGNGYLKLPILKYLFVPGTYLWLYLLLAAVLLTQKKYRMLLPLSLALGYYVTLFLGPTVQLRYLYPIMIALPFAATLALNPQKE